MSRSSKVRCDAARRPTSTPIRITRLLFSGPR